VVWEYAEPPMVGTWWCVALIGASRCY
jgi:hypothetical protein